MNEFYKHLRNIRKSKNLTQEELAERADISRVMVSRYETGSVIPTVDVLVNLADALEVSTDYLLGRRNHEEFADAFLLDHQVKLSPLSESDFPQNKEELRRFVMDVMKECFSSLI